MEFVPKASPGCMSKKVVVIFWVKFLKSVLPEVTITNYIKG